MKQFNLSLEDKRTFIFNGKEYIYFDHKSNQTYANERRVELPLAFEFIERFVDVIEIGNVSHHYHRYYIHDVIDLYEKVPWPVWNEDILTFTPPRKYEGALSISTVEHTENPVLAVERIFSLAPKVLITFPIGYHADCILNEIKANFYFMKRIDKENHWMQITDVNEVRNGKYNEPYPYANYIVIIIR